MAYQAQPQMVIQQGGGGNRNSKNLPVGAGGREWSNGLCGCCADPGTCCVAFFCPCIIYGKVKHRYDHLATQGTPSPNGGECVSGDCMLHACVGFLGFGFVLQMINRGNIRQRYSIRGGGLGDCCTALCCHPCELTQEAREIELEEQSFGQVKH